MSKLTDLVAESTALALTAVEEASRFGVRAVDLEHVLLALVVSDRPAGRLLREAGITLDAARTAVQEHHRDLLVSLGVEAQLPGDGRIRFHGQNGYDYTERAMKVMAQAGGWKRAGDSTEVLRELLTEPSGTIAAILRRLDIDSAELLEKIDATAPERRSVQSGDPLSRTHTVYIPAAPDDVWALVSTPERLPEWDVDVEDVRPDGDGWLARTRTVSPDGRVRRVRANLRVQQIERAESADHRVVWRSRYPDSPRANTRYAGIVVSPSGEGTRLTLTVRWERGAGPRGVLRLIAPITRFVLRPVTRFLLTIQASTLAAGISRVLRDG